MEVPRQRNSREENQTIKEGKIPEDWKEDPAKLRQKDTEARWTKKNAQTYYGYKDHVKVDTQSKLIKTYEVTDASVHDSQVLPSLLKKLMRIRSCMPTMPTAQKRSRTPCETRRAKQIHEKGYRNQPLTKSQMRSNERNRAYVPGWSTSSRTSPTA